MPDRAPSLRPRKSTASSVGGGDARTRRRKDPLARLIENERGGRRWTEFRKFYLSVKPLCFLCGQQGKTVAAAELHHIRGAHAHPEDLKDPARIAGLCCTCHDGITARERRGENTEADFAAYTWDEGSIGFG